MATVSFTRMEDGTAAEYQYLRGVYMDFHKNVADEVLLMLGKLAGPTLGYKIDRYQHCLQSASRAQRDGADEETVVCALLHDIGDTIAPENHSQLAAAVLRPYVSEKNHWIIEHHGMFQGYYYFHHFGQDRDSRDAYRGHEHFEACAEFCARWDQTSFDPDYDNLNLDVFEPLVRKLFEAPKHEYI